MTDKIDLSNDLIDFAANITEGEDILDLASDNIPGIRLLVRTYNTVSDKIFKIKVEKFIKYANNFTNNNSFKKFKLEINDNIEYRNKVSEYLLFKINKFDADYKLKIFSNACVDFFNGNISQMDLTEISETIDLLNIADIKIIKFLFSFNREFISIQDIIDSDIDSVDSFKTYSCILKLVNCGIILEEYGFTYAALNNKMLKKVSLSSFGNMLHKYL